MVIEQDKGAIYERWHISMDGAFDRLRRYARAHNEALSEVAWRVTTGDVPDELVSPLTEA